MCTNTDDATMQQLGEVCTYINYGMQNVEVYDDELQENGFLYAAYWIGENYMNLAYRLQIAIIKNLAANGYFPKSNNMVQHLNQSKKGREHLAVLKSYGVKEDIIILQPDFDQKRQDTLLSKNSILKKVRDSFLEKMPAGNIKMEIVHNLVNAYVTTNGRVIGIYQGKELIRPKDVEYLKIYIMEIPYKDPFHKIPEILQLEKYPGRILFEVFSFCMPDRFYIGAISDEYEEEEDFFFDHYEAISLFERIFNSANEDT